MTVWVTDAKKGSHQRCLKLIASTSAPSGNTSFNNSAAKFSATFSSLLITLSYMNQYIFIMCFWEDHIPSAAFCP